MSGIWHQWSVLYLNFGESFKPLMHHCDCVCWYDSYMVTNLLRNWYIGVETRSGLLASEIFGNTLLYPTSVKYCPGLERGALVKKNLTSLQKNLLSFNLLSAWPQITPPPPPTHTPHTPQNHTPKDRDTRHRIPNCYYFH